VDKQQTDALLPRLSSLCHDRIIDIVLIKQTLTIAII